MFWGQSIDAIFPFFIFAYGALVCFAYELPQLKESRQKIPPQLIENLMRHQPLARVCLVVGGFWSVQNLLV